jgi:hypothetical protein
LNRPLQQVPDPAVTTVEPLRVDAVQMSHASRKCRLRRLDEQVIVVSHQDIGVDPPAECLDHPTQGRQEPLPILVVAKDLPPLVAPAGHMPDRPRVIQP